MNIAKSIKFYVELKEYLCRFYCLNEEKLRAFQIRQFEESLKLIGENNFFINRNFLKTKLILKIFFHLNRITKFPFTEPADIFSQQNKMYINDEFAYIALRSSGTTGCPKNVYLSKYDWFYSRRLAYLRMLFSSGCKPFSKTVF